MIIKFLLDSKRTKQIINNVKSIELLYYETEKGGNFKKIKLEESYEIKIKNAPDFLRDMDREWLIEWVTLCAGSVPYVLTDIFPFLEPHLNDFVYEDTIYTIDELKTLSETIKNGRLYFEKLKEENYTIYKKLVEFNDSMDIFNRQSRKIYKNKVPFLPNLSDLE